MTRFTPTLGFESSYILVLCSSFQPLRVMDELSCPPVLVLFTHNPLVYEACQSSEIWHEVPTGKQTWIQSLAVVSYAIWNGIFIPGFLAAQRSNGTGQKL